MALQDSHTQRLLFVEDPRETLVLTSHLAASYHIIAFLFLATPELPLLQAINRNLQKESDAGFARPLQQYLNSVLLEPSLIEGLQVESARLFSGISADYGPPPPYESLHRGENTLMSSISKQVASFYRQADIPVEQMPLSVPDHLVNELNAMALICQRQQLCLQCGDWAAAAQAKQLQLDFLQQHLLQWQIEYAQYLQQSSREGFYRSLGAVLQAVLQAHGSLVDI